ncbi:hypothetical protein K200098A10_34300 [Flavonifractor plautii]
MADLETRGPSDTLFPPKRHKSAAAGRPQGPPLQTRMAAQARA